jgi:hypothetical protein
MRRLVALVVLLTLLPATAALGTDLDELLTRGKDASYSAEQVISCSTPDGERDALIRIEQDGDDLRVSSNLGDDVEITAGAGGWTLTRDDGLVAQANVDRGETEASPLYTVEERGTVEYLGRAAMAYLLIRDGEPRAELVIDDETGAVASSPSTPTPRRSRRAPMRRGTSPQPSSTHRRCRSPSPASNCSTSTKTRTAFGSPTTPTGSSRSPCSRRLLPWPSPRPHPSSSLRVPICGCSLPAR